MKKKLKLFLWSNESFQSDFMDSKNCIMPESSNAHSGGVVVLAETEEEAVNLIKKYTENIDIREKKVEFEGGKINTKPMIIPNNKKGVILYCDGDC